MIQIDSFSYMSIQEGHLLLKEITKTGVSRSRSRQGCLSQSNLVLLQATSRGTSAHVGARKGTGLLPGDGVNSGDS